MIAEIINDEFVLRIPYVDLASGVEVNGIEVTNKNKFLNYFKNYFIEAGTESSDEYLNQLLDHLAENAAINGEGAEFIEAEDFEAN